MVASPSRLAISSDPWVDRIFTFKAGNGELMLLVINNFGEFVVRYPTARAAAAGGG